MMRTVIFLFCITLFGLAPRHLESQNDKIVIDEDKIMSIGEVFKIVKSQTDYSFVYHEDLFTDFPMVKLNKGTTSLNKLLSKSLSEGGFYAIFTSNNTILIKTAIDDIKSQQIVVSGTVKDLLGLPIPGATVLIKGRSKGTATDFNGRYKLAVSDPANVLVFSSLGFESKEIVVRNQTMINVVLEESISQLDAVTITGRYYNTSQREETGGVSRIDAKIIEKQPVNNPLAAMQGHIPGVNITQSTGLSGGDYVIQIRGQNNIDIGKGGLFGGVNNPLFIVDGVPYDSGSLEAESNILSANIIPGGRVSPLNNINPADISNIEVLKDADATAIYGSRGANGVVIITTKKGKEGKTRIKLNIGTTLSRVTRFVDLLNTQQYLEVRREALENDGYTLETAPPSIVNSSPDLYNWDSNRYTNWQEVLIGGTAYRQNAQLSFSGGNEYTQFLLSGSYVNETTVFPGDFEFNKISTHFNINHQSEDKRFSLNASANYSSDINDLPGSDLTLQARTLAPNAPALFDDQGALNWENSTWSNPLALLKTEYNARSHSIIANSVLSYHPIPVLEFKANLGYNDNRLESYGTRPNTASDPNTVSGQSSEFSRIFVNSGSRQSWIIEPQVHFQKQWGDIDLKFLFGATFQQQKESQMVSTGQNFPSNELLFNLASAKEIFINNGASEYKYQAFFSRINLSMRDKYILNLTGRRDGSSRFGPGMQFGYFGAIGTAWLFSEENIFENSSVLSFGKIRASYGITGSDTSPDYAFYDSYEASGQYNGSGLGPTRLFNPNFSWEETKKLEAALELGFIEDKIFLSTAWYRNRTSNQLINNPLPATTGFSGVNANFDAIVQNTGIEIDIRTLNIRNEHFKWSTNFNITANKNKLVAFPGLEGSTYESQLIVGEPLSISQRYHFIGVDPETGVAQFEDYNNDGLINVNDRKWLEDLSPKYFGGLGNTIQYKNFKLDIFLQFTKQKSPKYLTESFSITPPGRIFQNLPVEALDRWQQIGDENPIQRYTISDNDGVLFPAWEKYVLSNAGLTDASFIRLRNVSLNYTVPKAFTKGMDVDLYFQGQNLFLITGYDGADPEVRGVHVLPPLRQFTLGLNFGF